MSADQQKIAKKYTKTGTRTVYNFDTKNRQRKENATKGGLIAEIAEFLQKNSQFDIKNLNIVNKEKLIAFSIGDDDFEIDLKQKRKKKA